MNIAIVSAGEVGTEITQLAALEGHAVALYDINPQALQRAQMKIAQYFEEGLSQKTLDYQKVSRARSLLGSTTILEHCAEADIIIDCSPEEEEIKKLIFERLDKAAPPSTILSTNTVSISTTVMASFAKQHPERVVGTHFFQPIRNNQLVEIVRTDKSPQHIIDHTIELIRQLGKQTIVVQDAPGFLVHRLEDVYTTEAVRILSEGGIEPETIDRLMESMGFGLPPLRRLDDIGLDKSLHLKKAIYEGTFHEPRHRPHPHHQKLVERGKLGRKSGEGFYKYDG